MGAVRDDVTISYQGVHYEIGRGLASYGIWVVGEPDPIEVWPDTPEGWYSAWARFATLEAPGSIRPVSGPSTPVAQTTGPVIEAAPALDTSTTRLEGGVSPGPQILTNDDPPGASTSTAGGRRFLAAALLSIGVALGVIGIFPNYLSGVSLAAEPAELVPHVIYFATWALSGVLILLGGSRLRAGALLAAGASVVTLGLFLADAGTPISGGAHLMGAGLVLSLAGWVSCFAGSALGLTLQRGHERLGRPRGHEFVSFLSLGLAAIGAAATFAPAWDSYVLQTSAGTTDSITAGNVFSNPGAVIAGNVVVMVAIVAVVIVAALWRPVARGFFLLAGAVIPLTAQAASAVVQVGEHTSPSIFGISPSAAAQSGLTITSGLTLAFWIYCAFVLALIVMGVSSLLAKQTAELVIAAPIAGTPAGTRNYAMSAAMTESSGGSSALEPTGPTSG